MKKLSAYGGWLICALLVMIIALQGCEKDPDHPLYEEEYTYEDVEAAYTEGYEIGYDNGCEDVCKEIESAFEDAYCLYHDHAHYRYIEDAIIAITNYADGQPVSQEELVYAIWDIHSYYNDLHGSVDRILDWYSK